MLMECHKDTPSLPQQRVPVKPGEVVKLVVHISFLALVMHCIYEKHNHQGK